MRWSSCKPVPGAREVVAVGLSQLVAWLLALSGAAPVLALVGCCWRGAGAASSLLAAESVVLGENEGLL